MSEVIASDSCQLKTNSQDIDLDAMKSAASAACNLMRVLANADRLVLLCELSKHELCVSEIEEMLSIRQPTLSQQLTVLRDEGLVNTRREGKKIYYSIASEQVLAVLRVLYEQFCPVK